jgi:Fic family protein
MRYDDFSHSPSGMLVPTLYGERAYVPNPLPPEINLSDIALSLGEAMAAIGELRGACRRLPNAYILIRPLQRREALTSSAMEGTYTTDDELILTEAGLSKAPSDDTQEVNNYMKALALALTRVRDEPISNRLLRDAHRVLLSRVGRHRGANRLPGEFKRDQNMIGGTTLATARFIPPPPSEAQDCMSALEKYINREVADSSFALIDLALVHYQIETIHPFADGNGRVGRMLISLMTVKSGLLQMPALYLSPIIERDKNKYIDAMYAVSSQGAWEAWLKYFFVVVKESCIQAIETIDRILALQISYRNRVGTAIRSANVLSIIDMLFESPVTTPRQIVERLRITDVAARNLLSKLCEMKILYEHTGIYPKAYIAFEIVEAAKPSAAQASVA